MSSLRIGYGEDIHRLVPDRKLILAGVHVPYELGLLGHSDADVVYHAISDSLLGALALGDIGKYFPPSDPKWEGVDSAIILRQCYEMVKNHGYVLGNMDIAISAEKPHLLRYAEEMRDNIAKTLEVDVGQIGLQLMTNEGLDAVGQGLAIRVSCVSLLERTSL